MNAEIIGSSVSEGSRVLLDVVRAFTKFYVTFQNLLQPFFEPEILLQSVGNPVLVDAEQFRVRFNSLLACRDNLNKAMLSFKRFVFGQEKGALVYSVSFEEHLHLWVLQAKQHLDILQKRNVFPQEQVLVEKAHDVYFEVLATLKEFNALIAVHNSQQSIYKIPLVNTSDLG